MRAKAGIEISPSDRLHIQSATRQTGCSYGLTALLKRWRECIRIVPRPQPAASHHLQNIRRNLRVVAMYQRYAITDGCMHREGAALLNTWAQTGGAKRGAIRRFKKTRKNS